MAKKDKASKKDKTEAKEEKAAEREYKFGVEDLASKLDIKPASVRVQLRNKGIEKAGKSYGWNTEKELKEVMSQLKAKGESEEGEAEEKSEKKAKKDKKDKKKSK